MKSTTKIHVTEAEIEEIAQQLLGRAADSSQELTDGWFNTLHRIDLDDGECVVLKLAPAATHPVMRYERNIMATEVAVLRLLGEKHGLPVPKVLAHDATGLVHPHELFLMEYVPGTSYSSVRNSLDPGVRARIDWELGRLSARINSVEGTCFGRYRHGRCTSASWSDTLVAMVDDLLLDASDAGARLPVEHSRLREAFTSSTAELSVVETPSLVHWDLHPGNVFVDGEKVTGLIDCDRALWGDPLMEFMFRTLGALSDAFYGGYDSVLPQVGALELPHSPAPHVARRLWLYDLYLSMVLVIECAFRGFDASHREWAETNLTSTYERERPAPRRPHQR